MLDAQLDNAAIAAQAPEWNKRAAVLDSQLAKTPFIAGNEMTIADIAIASSMHLHAAQRLPLETYPHLKNWFVGKIEPFPCWQKTQGIVNNTFLTRTSATFNGEDGAAYVPTKLNYTKDVQPRFTELFFYDLPHAQNIHEPGDDARDVVIYDAWPQDDSFSVDRRGFSLCDFRTKFESWMDEEAVRATFYHEIVHFLKSTLGAKQVHVFDHTIRSKANEAKKLTQETNTSQRGPVMLVHCDYSAESGPLRVKQLLPDQADDLLSGRIAFINVCKTIHHTVEECRLAMCDVTSTTPVGLLQAASAIPRPMTAKTTSWATLKSTSGTISPRLPRTRSFCLRHLTLRPTVGALCRP
jgi:hypothetical protein